MASILQSTAQVAHSTFASLVSASPILAGAKFPDVEIKINDMEDKINFSKLTGKYVLVLVPGAPHVTDGEVDMILVDSEKYGLLSKSFTPTCSSQVPGYIEQYSKFIDKGVKDIYVISVNDICVVNAWKEKLLGDKAKTGENVKFAADDAAKLASALGLVLDAQPFLGGPRLKRGAIIIEDGNVLSVFVEKSPGEVTVSHADSVLESL